MNLRAEHHDLCGILKNLSSNLRFFFSRPLQMRDASPGDSSLARPAPVGKRDLQGGNFERSCRLQSCDLTGRIRRKFVLDSSGFFQLFRKIMGLELVEQPDRKNEIKIDLERRCILCGDEGATGNHFCLRCSADSLNLKVPLPHEFRNDDGFDIDFLLSAELAQIGRRLIRHYEEDFHHLAELEIDYFWKKTGGGAGGKNTLGKCKKVSGTEKYYSQKDFLIWVAADNCYQFNYYQFTALIFHELCHAHSVAGKTEIRNHDFEGFGREVLLFGSWKSDIVMMDVAFKLAFQPKLFKK